MRLWLRLMAFVTSRKTSQISELNKVNQCRVLSSLSESYLGFFFFHTIVRVKHGCPISRLSALLFYGVWCEVLHLWNDERKCETACGSPFSVVYVWLVRAWYRMSRGCNLLRKYASFFLLRQRLTVKPQKGKGIAVPSVVPLAVGSNRVSASATLPRVGCVVRT